MRIFLTTILLTTLSLTSFAQENIDESLFRNIATIQILDKTTAKSVLLNLPIKEKKDFGSLKITAHKCWQAPLDQRPESKILLEVFESKSENEKTKNVRIFYGWIFASSPSISGLEHPIYDITAINCKN
jgi:hypothetical protein